jgi:hypothetical protein
MREIYGEHTLEVIFFLQIFIFHTTQWSLKHFNTCLVSASVGLLKSPNLMIFALFLKYQTDSPRSGLESGTQIYLLGFDKMIRFAY